MQIIFRTSENSATSFFLPKWLAWAVLHCIFFPWSPWDDQIWRLRWYWARSKCYWGWSNTYPPLPSFVYLLPPLVLKLFRPSAQQRQRYCDLVKHRLIATALVGVTIPSISVLRWRKFLLLSFEQQREDGWDYFVFPLICDYCPPLTPAVNLQVAFLLVL